MTNIRGWYIAVPTATGFGTIAFFAKLNDAATHLAKAKMGYSNPLAFILAA